MLAWTVMEHYESSLMQAIWGSVYKNHRWRSYYVRSLMHFSDAGIIATLYPAQSTVLETLEATCKRRALYTILKVSDIQFLSSMHVLHARTECKDHASPAPRRHLMRLWLATPEGEGGWVLTFFDFRGDEAGRDSSG